MASYRFYVQQILGYFDGCEFHHVRRENNEEADILSKLGSYRQTIPPGVSLEHLRKPSIKSSPESESIFIPAKPEPDVIPMDVDVGCVTQNPGTAEGVSGTAQENSGTDPAMSEEPISADPMEIEIGRAHV